MNFNLFYKKIDSTLRGQPDVEIEAMLDELGFDLAFIVPSFPANGRKVETAIYTSRRIRKSQNNFHAIGFVPDIFKNQINRQVSLIEPRRREERRI